TTHAISFIYILPPLPPPIPTFFPTRRSSDLYDSRVLHAHSFGPDRIEPAQTRERAYVSLNHPLVDWIAHMRIYVLLEGLGKNTLEPDKSDFTDNTLYRLCRSIRVQSKSGITLERRTQKLRRGGQKPHGQEGR